MKIIELKRRWHKWKCPWCGRAKLSYKNEGVGEDRFECPHYVAALSFSMIKEPDEITRYDVHKITRLSSMEDWNKNNWGLEITYDEDEGKKYLMDINADIEVRIIHSDDRIGIQYTSNFYKEEGAPYQEID